MLFRPIAPTFRNALLLSLFWILALAIPLWMGHGWKIGVMTLIGGGLVLLIVALVCYQLEAKARSGS